MKLALAGLALACLAVPAFADDCSQQADRLVAVTKKDGRPILADIPVTGAPYDREIIVMLNDGAQSLWFFDKGCLFGKPLVLMPYSAPSAPAAAPAEGPKPSAPEVGA